MSIRAADPPTKGSRSSGCFSHMFLCFSAFRQGMHDLKVWPNIEADPDVKSTTPGKTKDSNDQMSRLAKVG